MIHHVLPSATIVIAAHNAAKLLAVAIGSALSQDYSPLEVIVVDDGSEDETAAVAESFEDVVVIRLEENEGPSAARNHGIAAASGEYVGFLDADDEATPAKMKLQVGYLLEHEGVGCTLGRQEVVDEDAAPEWMGRDGFFGDLAGVPLMSLVTRRQTLLELGGFDPALRVAEDRDLLVRMREHGIRIDVLPDIVLRRRFHGGNLSYERPERHPILHSLKAKLARERARGGDRQ